MRKRALGEGKLASCPNLTEEDSPLPPQNAHTKNFYEAVVAVNVNSWKVLGQRSSLHEDEIEFQPSSSKVPEND